MQFASIIGAVSALVSTALGASTFSPLRPPAIPLAVASPYLSTWLQGDNLPGTWPTFWNGAVTGWQGFVSVDGAVYNWLGAAPGPSLVTQTAFEYTSTRSIFTFNVAGKIQMKAIFMTPVYPDDLVKKSLQYSYVETTFQSIDGGNHDVKVYMDISGEWMIGDANGQIWWDTGSYQGVHYHRIRPGNEVLYQEIRDQAAWGTVFLGTSESQGMTYQIGEDTVVRGQFVNNKALSNSVDTRYRAVGDDWPVVAYAHNLGSVGSGTVSTVFGIGLCQINPIQFLGAGSNVQDLTGQWYSKWSDGIYAMSDWVKGYANESAYATQLDTQVHNDAQAAGGADYAALTTLAVRQAFAGLQPAHGSQDYLFLKEISSDGDISTADVIFPAFPILKYFNNNLIKLLLDPLFENQENGHYPLKSAIHDLGAFPKALGYPKGDDEEMPVEECGNMLILTLAYAEKANDVAYLKRHYPILQQWTQYLIDDSLIPANQLSTDDFAGRLANQTNLALKGIIGIGAMGKIAQMTGNTDSYTSVAQKYITQWYGFGTNKNANPQHTELAYGDQGSWGLLYNLYADKLLGLKLVAQSTYDSQSSFYATVVAKYGVQLDTRHTWTKLDWEAWVAAIASSSVRTTLYSRMAAWVRETSARVPMSDWYETVSGTSPGFRARPVVGGIFAQLAL